MPYDDVRSVFDDARSDEDARSLTAAEPHSPSITAALPSPRAPHEDDDAGRSFATPADGSGQVAETRAPRAARSGRLGTSKTREFVDAARPEHLSGNQADQRGAAGPMTSAGAGAADGPRAQSPSAVGAIDAPREADARMPEEERAEPGGTAGRVLRRIPQRVVTRNAMRAARQCTPAEFQGALAYCQRFTARSRVWRTEHPLYGYATAWVSNVATCKLGWVCPVCSAARGYTQQQSLQRALRGWAHLGEDHRVFLMTLTVRHSAAHSLADLIAVVNGAFTATMNSRLARRLRAGGIFDGYIKTLEMTWSPTTGWNVHLHVLVFTRDAAGFAVAWNTTIGSHTGGFVAQWSHAVAAKSAARQVEPPVDAVPQRQDLREASLDDAGYVSGYLTKDGVKWTVAAEMTRSDAKRGRLGSYAPLQLLLAAGDGDRRARAVWQEHAYATKGVHRFASSLHDPATRETFQQHLQAAGDQAEIAEANIAAGWGDDPRAVVVRAQIAAEEADDAARAVGMTLVERTAEATARDQAARDYAEATEPSSRPLASFADAERLSGRNGRMTLRRLAARPNLLLDLLTVIEAADDATQARANAQAFMDAQRLPLSTVPSRRVVASGTRRRGRGLGSGDDGPGSAHSLKNSRGDDDDFDYYAEENRAEARLEAAGYSGAQLDAVMQKWEVVHRYLRPRARHPLWLIGVDLDMDA